MIIFHLSTVHDRYDNRILNKECISISFKYSVFLVVADGKGDESYGSVSILDIGKPMGRFGRMTIKTLKAFSLGRKAGAGIYHIHDPELIPVAFFYRLFGYNIVYDIHEDYITSILTKKYIPNLIRPFLAKIVGEIESFTTKLFYMVIAEKYYIERFPNAISVLNYPVTSSLFDVQAGLPKSDLLIYTGNITIDRGAMHMAKIACTMKDFNFKLVGKCNQNLANKVLAISRENIEIIGVNSFVPFNEITRHYAQGALAGLALFPRNPHYQKKELTKFFEYMAVGLPIISSDFPVWRQLIEGNGVGICVNPEDTEAVVSTVRFLFENPEVAYKMGKKGRELVASEFNWQKEIEKLLALYNKLPCS